MKTIKILIILLIVELIVIVGYAYSGLYNVGADTGHTPVVEWYIELFYDRSIAAHAADLNVPDDLDSMARIRAGAILYANGCAGCHGNPSRPPTSAFMPAPPALSKHAPEPAHAFWVIRHGLKGSAMPVHKELSDRKIWNIAAFLQKLPGLTPAEYESMTAEPEDDRPTGGQGQSGDGGGSGGEKTPAGQSENADSGTAGGDGAESA